MSSTSVRSIVLPLCVISVAAIYLLAPQGYCFIDQWEALYADVAHHVLSHGDWLNLTHTPSPGESFRFWSKPPLSFWLAASSELVLGRFRLSTESAFRLASAVIGVLSATAIGRLAGRVWGSRCGNTVILMILTSLGWAVFSHQVMPDIFFGGALISAVLCFCCAGFAPPLEESPSSFWRDHNLVLIGVMVLATIANLYILTTGRTELTASSYCGLFVFACAALTIASLLAQLARRRCERDALWGCVLSAMAALAKGPAGVAFPVLTVLVFLALFGGDSNGVFSRARIWIAGSAVVVCIALPWYLAEYFAGGMPFLREFLVENHLQRALGRFGGRGGESFYLRSTLALVFPWAGLAIVGLFGRNASEDERSIGSSRLLKTFCAVFWGVIVAVSTKFNHYALPLVPVLCVFAAKEFDRWSRGPVAKTGAMLLAGGITGYVGFWLGSSAQNVVLLFSVDQVLSPSAWRALSGTTQLSAGVTVVFASVFFAWMLVSEVGTPRLVPATAFAAVLWIGGLLTVVLPKASRDLSTGPLVRTMASETAHGGVLPLTWNVSCFSVLYYAQQPESRMFIEHAIYEDPQGDELAELLKSTRRPVIALVRGADVSTFRNVAKQFDRGITVLATSENYALLRTE